MPKQTADLIAIIFALVVAFAVVTTTAALLWIKLTRPAQDTLYAAEVVSRFVSVLVAALVGYMAGRGTREP